MLLVTGATGYVGATLLALLRERGLPVRVTVRSPERALLLPPDVPWVVADLAEPASVRRAAEGCEAVFHLAATAGRDAEQTRRLNVLGTGTVLEAARAAGVRRFVHTSSAAAIVDGTGLVDESAPPSTALVDPYSTSKAESERLVLAAAGDGLETVVVNPVNIYGPSPAGPLSYNQLFAATARGEVTEVVDATVGWVLASDVALGHLLAYERGESGRRYVLCGGTAPFGVVLHRYAELVGSPHRVRVLPAGSSLGPDSSTFASRSEVYGKLGPVRVLDPAARALGFAPSGLADGLNATAAWMSDLSGAPGTSARPSGTSARPGAGPSPAG
ncbi:MAG TPA: NAD-dependent epimerase/dehydratase family protein [Pseudonocardia sp.]|nr:NAD-dependent epimerase/dehydratase family protein [Pseudonocardia sp.]